MLCLPAGVEDSCEITASEMDAATLKLYALADIVIKLMGKSHSTHEWPVEIEELPDQLRSRSLREILQVNTLPFLPCLNDPNLFTIRIIFSQKDG
jgi:hypothetical protein